MSVLDRFSLDGKVALVTGASRGIGAAIADALAEAGATVLGVGRSPESESKASPADYLTADVTDAAAFEALAVEWSGRHGRLDVLVNAAGITLPALAATDPSAAFARTIAVDLVAAYDCSRAVVPLMAKNGSGSIINVTSIGASLGFPGNPGYAAAKGGLATLTRALAIDVAHQGIRVNNLVPGYVVTAMTRGSHSNPEANAARAARTMLGRWAEVDDLVGGAIFLASDASAYMTGSDLVIDGGWQAKGL